METFDSLPAPVRQWVAQAALPWSPASVRRIWFKSQAKGLSDDEALASLTQAEARTLARDRLSTAVKLATPRAANLTAHRVTGTSQAT